MGIPTFLPGRFSRGISQPGQFPHTLLLDISPNKFLPNFSPNAFPVALDDVLFVVGLAQTQLSQKQTRFSGIASWIFAESDHQSIDSSDV